MTKEQGAFRTIGELSKELSIKPHILRYWEDQFAMLTPLKRAGARRHYRPEAAAASLPLMTGDAPDNGVILAELKAIRDRLSHALDAA